jgi:hypothetical protein
MTLQLSDQLIEALNQHDDGPIRVEHPTTHKVYVIISEDQFERLRPLFDANDEFDPAEALPLAHEAFAGPEGWDAPGMEAYDDYDANKPTQ